MAKIEKPVSDCWQRILIHWGMLTNAERVMLVEYHRDSENKLLAYMTRQTRRAKQYNAHYKVHGDKWCYNMVNYLIRQLSILEMLSEEEYTNAISSITITVHGRNRIEFCSLASKPGSFSNRDTTLSGGQ